MEDILYDRSCEYLFDLKSKGTTYIENGCRLLSVTRQA